MALATPFHTLKVSIMKSIELTPAQSYMGKMVEALDLYLSEPENEKYGIDVLTLALERPKTLRAALSAHLYKSISSQPKKFTALKALLK